MSYFFLIFIDQASLCDTNHRHAVFIELQSAFPLSNACFTWSTFLFRFWYDCGEF